MPDVVQEIESPVESTAVTENPPQTPSEDVAQSREANSQDGIERVRNAIGDFFSETSVPVHRIGGAVEAISERRGVLARGNEAAHDIHSQMTPVERPDLEQERTHMLYASRRAMETIESQLYLHGVTLEGAAMQSFLSLMNSQMAAWQGRLLGTFLDEIKTASDLADPQERGTKLGQIRARFQEELISIVTSRADDAKNAATHFRAVSEDNVHSFHGSVQLAGDVLYALQQKDRELYYRLAQPAERLSATHSYFDEVGQQGTMIIDIDTVIAAAQDLGRNIDDVFKLISSPHA